MYRYAVIDVSHFDRNEIWSLTTDISYMFDFSFFNYENTSIGGASIGGVICIKTLISFINIKQF